MKVHWLCLCLLSMPACGSGDGGPSGAAAGGSDGGGEAGASGGAGASGDPAAGLDPGPGGFDPDFESSPDFLTRMTEPMLGLTSLSPHRMVQIFYSQNLEPILGLSAFGPLPEGSVAIKKQDRDEDGVIDQIMVMVKQAAGTDPDALDWVFEQYDPGDFSLVSSSETDESFRSFCSGCHAGFVDTDGLRGTSLEN
jgi:hypothetical protein